MIPTLLRCAAVSLLFWFTACSTQPEQATKAAAAAMPSAASAPATRVTPEMPATITDTTAVLNALIQQRFPKLTVGDFEAGDLNTDGKPDLIVVAERPCDAESGIEGAQCRTVLLVVNEGGSLRIAATNDNLVDCSECGGAGVGDPHQAIVMKGNYFTFESLYGACDKTAGFITFRYDRARRNWFLHRLSRLEYSCNDTTSNPGLETQQTVKNFGVVSFADYALQGI
ncbi:hypothetical protein [Hymenobacter weizhouensis]|uniref:hypothetical protein n=1 Tax=Hymenobacter sp. YIM 151500-1 TaxID=2987689 RepID=UPI00222611DB|nr:hypothetical protein [Hymenobacter sp. YIM 151500-1]UYZ65016.1 hypothetical protein OIS53_09220 [Hymenobacter sp. YIM 151500-1]